MALSKGRLQCHLPSRFPVGAKYVVEGSGGAEGQLRVIARYVVLPGGRRINLSSGETLPFSRARRPQLSRVPAEIPRGTGIKNLAPRRGTAARASR